MEYHGFRSIPEYERECRKHDLSTERVPFQRSGEKFFVLITRPPKRPLAWKPGRFSPQTKQSSCSTALLTGSTQTISASWRPMDTSRRTART